MLTKAVIWASVLLGFLHPGQATPTALSRSIPEYELNIKVIPEAHRLEANGTVRLPATDTARATLVLVLSDVMRDFTVEVLEPGTSAGAATLAKQETIRGQIKWSIHPIRPIPANASVLFRFSYAGGEHAAFVFSLGPECSFASGLNTPWYPQVEGENDRGIGTLKIATPAGYSMIATGKREAQVDSKAGAFQFRINQKSYFSFAAAKYSVSHHAGTVPTAAYLLHPRPNIDAYLDGCARILSFLSDQFGPYPSDEFAIVEVPTEQANHADFQGASEKGFILASSSFLDRTFSLPYFAHEIGHQWWGNLVLRTGSRGRSMLDEAMVQYGALLTVEHLEGAVAAEEFRRKGFGGGGEQYFKMAAAGDDHRLDEMPRDLSQPLAYGKGMLVLDMLSGQIGRERFRQVLRRITHEYSDKFITWDDFLREVQIQQKEDLRWFFAQWFEQPGAPDLQLSWSKEGNTVRGSVTQSAPYYRVTIEVEAYGTNYERLTRDVRLDGPRTEFFWPLNFRVHTLVLDPHFKLLHWTAEYRADALAFAPYYRANKLREAGKLDDADRQFRVALERVTEPDLHGQRFLLEYGLARVLFEENKPQEAKSHLDATLACPVRRADTLPFVYLGFALLAKGANDPAKLRWAIQSMTAADLAAGGATGVMDAARALGIVPQ